jgi:mannose-1-phosphate guanylyltransferase/phosphomannomutase
MRGFILAGGQGTRTLDPKLPKVLTQVNGLALLDLQLMELMEIEELSQITLLLGHGADKVIAHLERFLEDHPSAKLVDYIMESEPLGSGGMLQQVLSGLDDEICFVSLGDILPRGGIVESFHVWKTAGAKKENIVFVHPNNHPNDSDSVERLPGSDLVEVIISSKARSGSPRANLSPVGFFLLKTSDVRFWPTQKQSDLVQNILPALLESKVSISAKDILRRSLDIGTPDRLERVQATLTKVEMILNWAVFIDRDDTLIKDPTTPANKGKNLEMMFGVIPLIKILNDTGIPVICISNQPAIAKGQSTFQKIEAQNREIQSLLATENVYVDKWLYCPHHTETGFEFEIQELKISCSCRKPKNGMIVQISDQHNIDISKSVIIGDSFRDVEIEGNLGMRIHFLPQGNCDILTHHVCVKNFEEAKGELINFAEGSIANDYR